MGNVEITKKDNVDDESDGVDVVVLWIDMTIITMMLTRAMAILPTENNDANGNSKDTYANV